MGKKAGIWLGVLALAWVLVGPARGADLASAWFVTDQGGVRLVAAAPGAGEEGMLRLGLEFRLSPHWKIYWRSPGDAGFPPRLDWSGSTNLAGTVMEWPAPQRFSVLGLETVGYTDAVLFPITARLERAGAPEQLKASLSYLTCSEICIPYDTVLALDWPAGGTTASAGYGALIARAAAGVPGDGREAGLAIAAATLIPGSKPALELRVESDPPLAAPDAFIEGAGDVVFGPPRLETGDQPAEAVLRLAAFGRPSALDSLVGRPLTVTLVDGARAAESRVTPAAAPPPPELSLLLGILPLALLGGFILNLMPCVLPVLSLKLLGVVEQGGRSRSAVRAGFLASAAGVVLAFLSLAAMLVGLRAAGVAVGWGVQFQQPLFLVAMVALLTLFAANLFGFFEVPLPQALARFGSVGDSRTLLGNLAVGAFATLLAPPCSAPFLGTAVGFALAGSAREIFAVFLALGLGLAAPYLLVALAPGLALLLPRPGRWMLGLRRVLGAALVLTALWLLSVLMSEVGVPAAAMVAALMLALTLTLALLRAPAARRGLSAALVLAALVVPGLLAAPPGPAADAFWRPFDPRAIAGLVGDGRLVFVDVTADWCLTCKLNEKLVIDAPEVRRRLGRRARWRCAPTGRSRATPSPATSAASAATASRSMPSMDPGRRAAWRCPRCSLKIACWPRSTLRRGRAQSPARRASGRPRRG